MFVISAPPDTLLAQSSIAPAPDAVRGPESDDPPPTYRAPPGLTLTAPLTATFDGRQTDWPAPTVRPPVTVPAREAVHPTSFETALSLPVKFVSPE